LKYACCVILPFADAQNRVAAEALRVGNAAARRRAAAPLVGEDDGAASLLNTAVCQSEKFRSAAASRRTGRSGSVASSRMPKLPHEPATRL
jgi:hypothetical protein